jgi:hypothetical protein
MTGGGVEGAVPRVGAPGRRHPAAETWTVSASAGVAYPLADWFDEMRGPNVVEGNEA